MDKKYILTFSISFLVLATIVIITLMILLPQATIIDASLEEYDSISKSDYLYTKTKDISKEALIQQYTISDTEMTTFKNKNQYDPGNSDPFTPYSYNEVIDNNNSSSNSSNNNNSSQNTTDKITNSNGGTPNPPSTNK